MNTEVKLKQLKGFLKRGDAAIIARATGYSYHTVRAMIKGDRTLHPMVLEAIEKLVECRRKGISNRMEAEILKTQSTTISKA
ncbi:hypothetical protein [Tenuifilum osseticum]|uniref:hypothetical protein n=1 Tax=Tenuifilum osseticum TaxID=3374723 RepID=UPI0034E396A5